jgi:hypothetical protein
LEKQRIWAGVITSPQRSDPIRQGSDCRVVGYERDSLSEGKRLEGQQKAACSGARCSQKLKSNLVLQSSSVPARFGAESGERPTMMEMTQIGRPGVGKP